MLEKGDILKWNLEGPILKKVKLLRDRVLNKNEDAVGIPDGDLHITLRLDLIGVNSKEKPETCQNQTSR